MSELRAALEDYLAVRRGLGFKLRLPGSWLQDFVSFAEQEGSHFITTKLALRWAQKTTNAQPAQWANRLGMVRQFAQYRSATDPRTEIPPQGLLPHRYRRKAPYIYRDEEIRTLIDAAKQLPSSSGLRPWTFSTLFGLIAVTGTRVGEPIALNREDVDLSRGDIFIHQTKFGKSRLVPVHPSTQKVLQEYARRRDAIYPCPKTPSFFLSERGTRLTDGMVRWTFVKISHQIGLRGPTDRRGPRLQDLRHTFTVRTIMRWYRAGLDVEQHLPELSTYLGHAHVAGTYWYLSATPELLQLVAKRQQHTKEARCDEDMC